jgi:hypothetical protein
MPLGSEERIVERISGKLLVWIFALTLVLALIGLIAATSESLRRQEHTFPFTKALEPELLRQHSEAHDLYHGPTVAGWPTP